MYCPICFNDTLSLKKSGVVHLIINGKQMDTGRFLFNLEQERPDIIIRDFSAKIEDFFKWYSSFQNQLPITEIYISSSDYSCQKGCKIPMSNKFSIVDTLIPRTQVNSILDKMAEKYELEIELRDAV
ncbi:MAG: hypothetical protein HN576_14105 [Bacteriovoracaceae bacterium]|jgi:hypothetical protein|nr:hypothetical protein [Bacteriovoracaceae bacterium]